MLSDPVMNAIFMFSTKSKTRYYLNIVQEYNKRIEIKSYLKIYLYSVVYPCFELPAWTSFKLNRNDGQHNLSKIKC